MDRRLEQEQALSDQHDYQVCMAKCAEGQNCDCNYSEDPGAIGWIILVMALLIWPGVLIWGSLVIKAIDAVKRRIKHKKKN